MNSDVEYGQMRRASGAEGKRAQMKELERQLRHLPKWLEAKRKYAARQQKAIKAKIARLAR